MKVVVKDIGEFNVKDIPYGEARKLHRDNAKTFWNMDQDEKIDADSYYDLLEKVKIASGIKESELKKHTMVEVDLILQQILMRYTGIDPKDSGG